MGEGSVVQEAGIDGDAEVAAGIDEVFTVTAWTLLVQEGLVVGCVLGASR